MTSGSPDFGFLRKVYRPGRCLAGLLGIALLAGIATFRDFGVSWDEPHNYYYGHALLNSLLRIQGPPGNPDVYRANPYMIRNFGPDAGDYFEKTHGPAYELALAGLERLLRLGESCTIHHFRHFCGYLTFLGAVALFYVLAVRLLQSAPLALTGCVFLLLSPRLFAHAFHNSIDIPFLTAYLGTMLCSLRFLETKSGKWAVLAGIATGLTIDIRIAGVFLPVLLTCFLAVELLRPGAKRQDLVVLVAIYVLVSGVVTTAFWPTLWQNPVAQFSDAFRVSANDPWDGHERYFGRVIWGHSVPWHFTPVWLAITTPALYTVLFLCGLAAFGVSCAGRRLQHWYWENRNLLYVFACFAGPLTAVGVLGATLFNGWRHLFFVYPAFLVFALIGLRAIWNGAGTRRPAWVRTLTAGAVGLSAVCTIRAMVHAHPQQHTYFSLLAGSMRRAVANFEIGYWGPEFAEPLRYILAHDPRPVISMADMPVPFLINLSILSPAERSRIELVPLSAADYYIYNYYSAYYNPENQPVAYTRAIDGQPIVRVYRMDRPLSPFRGVTPSTWTAANDPSPTRPGPRHAGHAARATAVPAPRASRTPGPGRSATTLEPAEGT